MSSEPSCHSVGHSRIAGQEDLEGGDAGIAARCTATVVQRIVAAVEADADFGIA